MNEDSRHFLTFTLVAFFSSVGFTSGSDFTFFDAGFGGVFVGVVGVFGTSPSSISLSSALVSVSAMGCNFLVVINRLGTTGIMYPHLLIPLSTCWPNQLKRPLA